MGRKLNSGLALVLASSLGSAGCQDINWGADMGDVSLAVVGATAVQEGYEENNPALVEQGKIAGNIAASRAGRSNVTQVNNSSGYGSQPEYNQNIERPQIKEEIRPHIIMFACKRYKGDLNSNGLADFPNEFEGIGDRFYRGENIMFVMEINEKPPFEYFGELWREDQFLGKSLVRKIGPADKGNMYVVSRFTPPSGSYGDFSLRCFVDNEFAGAIDFEVPYVDTRGIKRKR